MRWRAAELSGGVLAQVAVPTALEPSVLDAEVRTYEYGIVDDRPAIAAHWRGQSTWQRAPVLLTGDVSIRPKIRPLA